jgi:hypothetical protein
MEVKMTHLKEEDMARMISGNVGKKERKKFLEHLSRCESCHKVFTETLRFIAEEEKGEDILRLPAYAAKKESRFRQVIDAMFKKPVLVPALAAAIIILLMVPFFITGPGPDSLKDKRENAKAFVSEITSQGPYNLGGWKNIIDSAVCTGIIVEDLFLFVKAPVQEQLSREMAEILMVELRNILKDDKDDINKLLTGLSNIKRENLQKSVDSIEEQLVRRSLSEPYRLGRFLEQTLLETFDEKKPGEEEIDKYLQMAREMELPPGVVTRLAELKKAPGFERIRSLCKEIKKIFIE